ncbi:MAG TPA: glutathione S-transferase family protein [Aliidongia sp.]|nr:glutathione S-transferase family protein [Aliidongia sp.]
MFTVYGDLESGNCYKVYLLLKLLGIEHGWVRMDVVSAQTRTPEFLAKNPNGRVPLLEIEPGVHLAESGAILAYLADGTPYFPSDRLLRARVLQWMFFEQYSHEPYIATSRYYLHFLKDRETYATELARRRQPGLAALGVMEGHLAHAPYFVGERLTIADIALYAYTHVAHEGDFDLTPFPAIRAWLARIANRDGFAPMR